MTSNLVARILGAVFLALVLSLGETSARAAESVAQRVEESLVGRGLGRDAMFVIPNTVFRAGQEPARATEPAFLRQIQAVPRLLDDSVGQFADSLRRVGWPVPMTTQIVRQHTTQRSEVKAVNQFARRADNALRQWRRSVDRFQDLAETDRGTLSGILGRGEIPHDEVVAGLDAKLDVSTARLGKLILPLLFDLVAAGSSVSDSTTRGVSRIIGTLGPDRYRPDVASGVMVIIDPGGDDEYDFSGLGAGGVVIVVDHAGADRYAGAGGVLSVLVVVDRAGDDRWGGPGAGPSSAFGGITAVADLQGDDLYDGAYFDQAAAVLGRSILVDVAGNDRYRLNGLGQGFAGTAGAAVLVDIAGDDSYRADGQNDALGRGGRVSKAQGVGFGSREGVAGGIGVLIDHSGDDTYDAEMFAQGHGFFFGMGLLADRAGDDRYTAVRYAQGEAAHVAIGVLEDSAGDDSYVASVGVSQGMGLDRSIGLLRDRTGDDSYVAGSLAQGASTANGLGVLIDDAGADTFSLNGSGWGQGHWSGGLPGVAAMLGVDRRDEFVVAGERQSFAVVSRGGPFAAKAPSVEGPMSPECVPFEASGTGDANLVDSLANVFPFTGGGPVAEKAHRAVRRALSRDLAAVIAVVGDNEHRGLGLFGVLRCVVKDQGSPEADRIIEKITAILG
ncbi:MAG: hypothetical protein HQ495_11675, partial [Alphaproteobacteria bacterium]|nr:hypothetical protein [Alphaproteobacteria bacterium]